MVFVLVKLKTFIYLLYIIQKLHGRKIIAIKQKKKGDYGDNKIPEKKKKLTIYYYIDYIIEQKKIFKKKY